ITYIFYRKTFNAKVIYVETEQDRAVVATNRNNEALLFGPNKEPIHCASLCTIRISRGGYGHVTRSDILNELTLKLENVVRIVTFQFDMSGESWDGPKRSELDMTVLKLDFQSLSRGDYVKITALCEQKELTEIIPLLRGRIKDTII